MLQRGRKSTAAALSVVASQMDARVTPPPGLTAPERAIWRATVNSRPADHFGLEHVPMLVEYVRYVSRGEVINDQLKAIDVAMMGTPEGVDRYHKLFRMAAQTTAIIKTLATSMRLTQQSVVRKDKVYPTPGRKLWQREAASN